MKQILATILATALAALMPMAAIEDVARLLVPAVALMATSIFPCMTLVVGAMKGEQRTPALIDDLYGKLRLLMKILVAAFAVAIVAIFLIVVAAIAAEAGTAFRGFELAHIAAGLAGTTLAIFVGRIIAIGKMFFEVLDINRKHALLIARAKSTQEQVKAVSQIGMPISPPQQPRPLTRIQ